MWEGHSKSTNNPAAHCDVGYKQEEKRFKGLYYFCFMYESIFIFSENNDQEDLNQKLEAMEKERGELTSEVMTKDSLIGKLEKESSSLKAEVAQLETSHTNAIAEHERKFIQLSEEMAAKVAEVRHYGIGKISTYILLSK